MPPLPGSFQPDGNPDFDANVTLRNAARWEYLAPGNGKDKIKIYSPLYGAVLWSFGGIKVAGDVGNPGSVEFTCSGGAGCNKGTTPDNLWRASLIAVASVEIAGGVQMGPANPAQGYHIQFIAGRDLVISGTVGPKAGGMRNDLLDQCAGRCRRASAGSTRPMSRCPSTESRSYSASSWPITPSTVPRRSAATRTSVARSTCSTIASTRRTRGRRIPTSNC